MSDVVLRALSKLAERYFGTRGDPHEIAKRLYEECHQRGIQLVFPEHPGFFRLLEIPDPPPVLFVLGNVSALSLASLAIVGTRQPSTPGVRAAWNFSRSLAARGFGIISGLARGIDGAAHRGTLSVGGYTVAVMGHGLDRVYPRSHERLAAEILEKRGCLVSEYPPFVPPLRGNFPRRNRLISGLSLGVLVVEAHEKSGSLITARLAAEQNRDVFALPGSFDDRAYRGSHALLRQGAQLVTSPDEILSEFPVERIAWPEGTGGDPELQSFFAASGGIASLEQLAETSGLPVGRLIRKLNEEVRRGQVYEFKPQNYLWGEGTIKGEERGACQTDLFSQQYTK